MPIAIRHIILSRRNALIGAQSNMVAAPSIYKGACLFVWTRFFFPKARL